MMWSVHSHQTNCIWTNATALGQFELKVTGYLVLQEKNVSECPVNPAAREGLVKILQKSFIIYFLRPKSVT